MQRSRSFHWGCPRTSHHHIPSHPTVVTGLVFIYLLQPSSTETSLSLLQCTLMLRPPLPPDLDVQIICGKQTFFGLKVLKSAEVRFRLAR
jgi:hypothetical protein